MANITKLIIWQKWRDPFGEQDDDIDIEDNDGLGDFYNDDSEEEDDNIEQNITDKKKFFTKQIKVIATPMGVIPVNENTSSVKIFNFWLGHTNFNLTKGVCTVIENIDGVETLDIFTRYRFRIGVGKAFKDSEVMQEIQESVYSYIEENEYEKN
jgi:hypothetical protein